MCKRSVSDAKKIALAPANCETAAHTCQLSMCIVVYNSSKQNSLIGYDGWRNLDTGISMAVAGKCLNIWRKDKDPMRQTVAHHVQHRGKATPHAGSCNAAEDQHGNAHHAQHSSKPAPTHNSCSHHTLNTTARICTVQWKKRCSVYAMSSLLGKEMEPSSGYIE